jgi:glyoxylase-like metal-dependent hydrolase (beta-lactamase superfamily II)
METREIRPGLWRWTEPHPAWKPEKGGPGGWERDVACVYLEMPEAVVLIDPLAPAEGTEDARRFWAALDRDIVRLGRPVEVLVGNSFHGRSADLVRERYARGPGVSVRGHSDASGRASCSFTGTFRDGDILAGGVTVFEIHGLEPGEVAFHVPAHRCVVFSDAVIGAGGGSLRLAPLSWATNTPEGAGLYRKEFRASIARLALLPVEIVLPSHGEPAVTGGKHALEEALASPGWGE